MPEGDSFPEAPAQGAAVKMLRRSPTRRNRRRIRSLSMLFLAMLMTASVVSALAVRGVVHDNQRSLLRERAAEVNSP